MKKYLLVLLYIVSISCSKIDTIKPNEKITVSENASLSFNFDSKELKLKVDKIEDSRCPANVVCFRAGEAIVKFDLTISNEIYENLELCIQCTSPLQIPSETNVGGYTLKLIEVNPFPSTENEDAKKIAVFQMN